MKKEIEALFIPINKKILRNKLKKIGFKLEYSEYLMQRKTFDFPKLDSGQKKWGRVRKEYQKITMTIKEISGPKIEDTYETELIVNNFELACLFLENCGLIAKSFQENLRELWVLNDTEVSIDTWPGLQPFVEIESKDIETVKNISKKLKFDFKNAIFGSIDLVYEKKLGIPAKKIISLPEITFKNPPKNTT